MNNLIMWAPQMPVKQITAEVKKMLKGSDWKTAREVQALGKVGQRKAEVTGMKDYVKVLKQTTLRAERRMGEILRDMEKAKGGKPYQKSTGSLKEPVRFTKVDS